MFTDMVGYTALTQNKESLALGLLQTQSGILLPLIRGHQGTPIKTIGDAHLAEFESALEAVLCAVEIQRRILEYNRSAPPEQTFKLRVGIHVGDVVHTENDVFGDAVNIASRIEPLAEPGGICLSQQVYDQVQNKVEFKLEKIPFHQLKNVSAHIEVYKLIDARPDLTVFPEQDMPKERVAVLPLSNFSPNQQDEYLADGMTEELITAISGVEGLRVIARTSVMKYKNKETDIREIGYTLNAGTVLEGSFRKIGERIRVTVQLIDAKTEEHRWAQNYDGDMQDIFSIQTDIAGRVAQVLQKKLLEGPGQLQKSVNIEAYELYLKGRQYWNRRNPEGVSQALTLFTSAIDKEPTFAKAYAGVADCYIIGASLQLFKERGEAESKAEAAILKAIDLDNTIAEAYASHGLLLNNQDKYAEAVKEFKRALSLNPSYATAHHWYSICLANLGKLDEAVEEARLASQADPLSPPARNILGAMYIYERRYGDAIRVFDDILKLEPDFSPSLSFRSNAYAYKGMEQESMRDMVHSLQNATDFDRNSSLAYQHAWFGRKEEGGKYFEDAKKMVPSQEALTSLNCGYFACLGDADGFFTWAKMAIDQRVLDPEDVRYAPWLDKVREDPRYGDLLQLLPM
jgi:TolB-like protein/Tfp pilus assembly protein PilF